MADRSNWNLNYHIEREIYQWDGTIYGYELKNAYENGTDYESLLYMMGEDYADWEED